MKGLSLLFVVIIVTTHHGSIKAEATLPPLLKKVGFDQKLDQQLPLDLPFRDESGGSIELGRYFSGKPVILVLAYYRCPMLCTLVLNGLVRSLADVPFDAGKDFEVVVVSIDSRETPQLAADKKRTYVERYGREGTADGWHFLTSPQPSIDALADAVGFRFAFDAARDEFAHASGIVVLTPQGRISRYFYDVKFSPRDVRLGLVEASHNKIGSPIDQVLLFCFHYDPAEGKYGATIMSLVRVGGVLTMLAVVGLLAFLSIRAPRKQLNNARSLGLSASPFSRAALLRDIVAAPAASAREESP
jgi:protein SCO1